MRIKGKVKWFNSRLGYGFIQIISDSSINEDIFVHHRALKCRVGQYKYLVQGEYVEFEIVKVPNIKYSYAASDVTGILGNKLLCETRVDFENIALNNDVERTKQEKSKPSIIDWIV